MKKEFFKDGIHYVNAGKASLKELYTKKGMRSIALARRFASALPEALGHWAVSFGRSYLRQAQGQGKQEKAGEVR